MSEKVEIKVSGGKTTKPKKAKKVVAIALNGNAPPNRKVKAVKTAPGFSSIHKFKNLGVRSAGRDTPEEFRAKLQALALKFPMMMPQTVGDGGSSQAFLDLPVAAMSSLNRLPAQFFTVTSPAAGNYFYAFLGMQSVGLHNPVYQATAMDATTDGKFATFTQSDDNLYSLVSSFVQSVQCSSRCVRSMNATPLLTNGGEVLMGTIPSSLVVANLTWSTLFNYIDVQQVDLPLAQDVCFAWMPSCVSDLTSVTPITTATTVNASQSMLFVAIRIPYSSTGPAMDIEFYSNYTVTPLPNYEKVIQAKVQPLDDKAFIAAKRTIGLTNSSSRKIEPTSMVGTAFKEAASSLGKNVLSWVSSKAKGWLSGAMDSVAGLFGNRSLHQLMVMQQVNKASTLEQIAKLEEEKIFPLEFSRVLREFLSYDIRYTNVAIEITHPDMPTYIAERVVASTAFDSVASVRVTRRHAVSRRQQVVEEDEKEFVLSTPPPPRSASLPRSKT